MWSTLWNRQLSRELSDNATLWALMSNLESDIEPLEMTTEI